MKRQRLVSSGSLSRTFEAAAEAWKRQDYQEAIDLLERAHTRDPAYTSILLDLSRPPKIGY